MLRVRLELQVLDVIDSGVRPARPRAGCMSEVRVRVEYQNCNQVICEELPLTQIRRRSEALRYDSFVHSFMRFAWPLFVLYPCGVID